MTSSHDERVVAVAAAFERTFGRAPDGIAEAPGRVNLIGEHVDYNQGLVLPFAIDRSVMCAWARRDNRAVAAYSVELDELAQFEVARNDHSARADWSEYVAGVAHALVASGARIGGLSLSISGDVPQGAGLSSSAALELAVAGAFRDAFALPIDDVALAQLCQRAENEFVGVQCGIMDQFASALSKRGHALFIDCRTLAYEHVPLRLDNAGLVAVIVNSAVKRELVDSAYNHRRDECADAVGRLRPLLGRPNLVSLRDVTPGEIAGIDVGPAETALRRARHVVTEIARVEAAVEALRRDDFAALGQLMAASHGSLRDDFEVSCPELDLLVELAVARDYVAGARMTGAGFGGCTINLVQRDALDSFEREVVEPYRQRTGLQAETYVTSPSDGLRAWRIN